MTLIRYYIRDAFQGMKRNGKACIATILLICISLSIMGSFLLVKQSANGVISFLETQVKIKVFVKEDANIKEVEKELKTMQDVKSIHTESKKEMLERMKGFFKGKEYLFEAFQESSFPYAILVEAKDETKIEKIAKHIEKVDGVESIVYPQTFAKQVLKWTHILNQYGVGLLLVFGAISFLTTQLAISLSLYQRKQEIRVKLLLGAKESHVRRQFLFEGWMMAFIGSVGAAMIVYFLDSLVMTKLYEGLPIIFQDISHQMNTIVSLIMIVGSLVGIIAAYFGTRGMMKDA